MRPPDRPALVGCIDGARCIDVLRRRNAFAQVHRLTTTDDDEDDAGRYAIFVTIRGTCIPESVSDALDIRCSPHRLSNGATAQVHRGFLAQYRALEPRLTALVLHTLAAHSRATQAPATSLVFSGHSMGGAVAMLAAERFGLLAARRSVGQVVAMSFGCPRFASEPLFASLRARDTALLNVHIRDDPIPWLPMASAFAALPRRIVVPMQDGAGDGEGDGSDCDGCESPAACCRSSSSTHRSMDSTVDDTDDAVLRRCARPGAGPGAGDARRGGGSLASSARRNVNKLMRAHACDAYVRACDASIFRALFSASGLQADAPA
jgi:pimeloyl-ACP methyl ester carboxylesterase